LLLVSVEVTPDEVAHDETANTCVSSVGNVLPKPSEAAVLAVVFDSCFGGCIRFGRPVRAKNADTSFLYRSEKFGGRFLFTERTDF